MSALPVAAVRPRRRWSWLWLLPLLAACAAVWLFYAAWSQRGIPLHISFQQGHGLKPGDALRYRGIEVGRVREVRLGPELGTIRVEVRLQTSARDLARAGSRFWIVRPRMDLHGASGLETLIGANYLSVLPGAGDHQREFVGLEDPPLRDTLEPGGLDLVLYTAGQGGLRPGAPVSYRQVVIGTLVGVDLARDASAVEARAYIKPEYTGLIRERARFWKTGGARLDAGWLRGLTLQVDSLQSLLAGGVTLAIPPEAGPPVASGHRFPLADEPQPEWLEWISYLDIGGDGAAVPRPQPVRAELRWRAWEYFIPHDRQRAGWLLPVADGLLGPADLLRVPDAAARGSVQLVLGEVAFGLDARSQAKPYAPGLALLPYLHTYPAWPDARRRTPATPEDALVVAGGSGGARFVAADAFRPQAQSWELAPAQRFDAQWHGAAVVAASDGALLGILLVEGEQARMAGLVP